MAIIIDVLMPAAGSEYGAAAGSILDGYRAAFGERGMTLRPRPWDLGPGDGDATLALFAWGYHLDVGRWQAMLAAWPADRPLFNAAALLAWNTRKTYLAELEANGIPIVPSRFGHADTASIAAAFDHFGGEELVIKPQVSGGSHRTVRVGRGDPVEPLDDAIIQPFVAAVSGEGELSFLYIAGQFSHAVRKVAAAGDFRIQPQFGGIFTRFAPEAEQRDLADRIIAALPEPALYTRVDLLRLADGNLALMELEAIEPDLYPHLEPELPARLANALGNELGINAPAMST
ncbi:transporter [Sphingomonas sp. So64.6b]|uniref:ATP-grasp domain-containing protein n=1 Tax=Sphingomonas sp. So64.6b TaxID=2997354 RepID=UPI0015FEFFCA|nr:transporter [Sphingomonas sp. So64.6b]QNA83372.1 transporter [Sphingomonas sp. So64.6b]